MTNGLPLREVALLHSTDDIWFEFDSCRRTAVAQLLSGVYQGAGLFLLAGETGIGKSTLLRNLHRQIAALDGVVLLSPAGPLPCRQAMTLQHILDACEPRLRLHADAADPLRLARRLQQMTEDDCVPVLLADDADQLGDAALEALVTLASLQAGQRRLLSVVVAGPAELASRLALPSDKAALPEGGRVVTLQPLAEAGVARVLQRRLSAAFEPEAVAAIAHAAGGIPARVIEIGERALQLAAHGSSASVTLDIAAAAAAHPGDQAPRHHPHVMTLSTVTAEGALAAAAPHAEARPAPEPRSDVVGDASADVSGAAAFGGVSLEPPVGTRTTRLTPTRRRSAGIGAKLAIAGGVGFALLLAVGSSLFIDDKPAGQASDRSLPDRTSPGTGVAGPVPSVASPSAAGDTASVADAPGSRNSAGAGSADRRWRPPSWEESSLRAHEPDVPGSNALVPDDPAPTFPGSDASRPEASQRTPGSQAPVPSSAAAERSGSTPAWDTEPDAWASGTSERRVTGAPTAALAPGGSKTGEEAASPAPSATIRPDAKVTAAGPTAAKPERTRAERPSAKPSAESPLSGSGAQTPPAEAPLVPSRKHQISALLEDGDSRLQEGDVEAARASYENAFERGSGEAARRLAETFDPRSLSPSSSQASPAEAILWYQDAARKGDRRAKAELSELENWLEDSAASGDREARRVLDAWRRPAEPEDAVTP